MTAKRKPAEPEPAAEPHNLEAERAALGAALMSQGAADYLADHLEPDSFYRHAHRLLFIAVQQLRHGGAEVDLVTLRAKLGKDIERIGGPAYITGLTDGRVHSQHVGDYANILEDLRAKRLLIRYAREVQQAVLDGAESAPMLVNGADRKLMELQAGYSNGRMASIAAQLPMLMEDLEYRSANRGQLLGLDTGFKTVNELTLGWRPGDMIIIAARPSIGKSTFVKDTAVAAALAGARVAYFSLEDKRQQVEYRILSGLTGIVAQRILTGYINDGDWPRLTQAMEQLETMRIELDDTTGRTVWDIRRACRRLKVDGGLDLVIVDYVQLMPGTIDKRGASRNEEVTDISRRLKIMADEAGVPVILVSQLNRGSADRPDPRPKLTDLRESGSLEQDADVVCFLHRKNHREGGSTEFIVEKARNGPTGSVILTLDLDTVTFTDGGEPLPPPTVEEKTAERKTKQASFLKQRARRH